MVRRDVFAPRGGLVDEVLVAHGAEVAAGQPLVRLRDPQLELELKRVDGELETAQRQIDAVRATRTNRQIRDTKPADGYRLSAEERELEQRLVNLRHELELLNREREALVVTSPIAGRVLSWDLAHRLAARPVERGEVLVTVADLSAELATEAGSAGRPHRLRARGAAGAAAELPVRFRLSSDDSEEHTGRISEVSRTADVNPEETTPSPTVQVTVALDALNLRRGCAARAAAGRIGPCANRLRPPERGLRVAARYLGCGDGMAVVLRGRRAKSEGLRVGVKSWHFWPPRCGLQIRHMPRDLS